MRATALFPIVILAGCASSGATAGAPATQTVRVVGPSSTATLSIPGSDRSNSHELPYPLEQVWRLLPAALDSLGIPVGVMDPARRTAGNTGFKVRGRLKNVPLSRYIDCGNSTQIGPNADSYDVNLALIAAVRSVSPTTSSVTITFEAVGRPATFAQEYSQCTSKGVLETRLMDVLASRLRT